MQNVVVQSPRARQRLNFENKSGNENTTETIKDSEPMNSSMTMHRQQSGVKVRLSLIRHFIYEKTQ